MNSLFLAEAMISPGNGLLASAGDSASALAGISVIVGILGLYMLIPLSIFVLAVFGIIIWILMLIDCVKRDFEKPDDKTIWVLVVVLAGWIGAIIYYFMIKKPNKH